MKNGGFTKVENHIIQNDVMETKLIYNYKRNPYNLEIIYPASWSMLSRNLKNDLTTVQCKYDRNKSYTTAVTLYEIDIDEEMENRNSLEILESKIIEYVDSIGSIYEVNNFSIEQLIFEDGNSVDILNFEYNEGKYYKTYCYCKVEIVDSIMYIATVGICKDEFGDEMLEIKDSILKSFKVSE